MTSSPVLLAALDRRLFSRLPSICVWCLLWLAVFTSAALSLYGETLDELAREIQASGYVSDFAGVLSQPARDRLTSLCTEVDQKTQAQIAVVTVKSLDGRSIDQYGPDLFAKVGVG